MRQQFDPDTLRLFVAVCDERSIARAAEREAIVPSAISKRVAALEAQVGVTLLERGNRGIAPTPAGEAMLRQARDILAAMERAHTELAEFRHGVRGSIRVLASLSALSEKLPDDVAGFLAQHSTLRVSLDERVSSVLLRDIREGAADFGVCWNAGDLAGLDTLDYHSDHLCAVVPAAHPLASHHSVAYADTLDFEQIEIQAGSIVQSALRRSAAIAGRSLRYRMQVTTFDVACRNVAAGLGIAIVPREAVESYARALGLRLLPLTDTWAERRFIICMRSRSTLSEVAGMLVDHLHQRAISAPQDKYPSTLR